MAIPSAAHPLRSLARRVGVVLMLPALVGTTLLLSAPAAEAAYTPSAGTVAAYEARVIYDMNVQRVKYRRARLVASSCPDRYAEWWALHLARTGLFIHRSMTALLTGCHATRVAENLARGYTADGTVAAWMRSAGHRANILDGRLTRVGVAAVYARGQWTVVADFARY